MDVYLKNLSVNVILLYLIFPVVLSGLVSLLLKFSAKYIFHSEFNVMRLFKWLTVIIMLTSLYFILTDEPYMGRK
jgi:hypothetical protein